MANYSSVFAQYINYVVNFFEGSDGMIVVDIDTMIEVDSDQSWKLKGVGDDYIMFIQKKSDDPNMLNEKVYKYLPIDKVELRTHGFE